MLTPLQKRTLTSVADYMAAKGHAPSFDEIGELAGITHKSAVHRVVMALEARGFLERDHGRPRSIRLTGACPCCGRRG